MNQEVLDRMDFYKQLKSSLIVSPFFGILAALAVCYLGISLTSVFGMSTVLGLMAFYVTVTVCKVEDPFSTGVAVCILLVLLLLITPAVRQALEKRQQVAPTNPAMMR